MGIILFLSVVLGVCYLGLMLLYRKGWLLQPDFVAPSDFKPPVFFSVIIPARNEAQNIEACVRSIVEGSYPSDLFEIIVVDDHSDDNTAEIVENLNLHNVRCIRLAEYLQENTGIVAYKKLAINTGIEQSEGELIITTDADCIVPVNWLKTVAAIYAVDNPIMIVGPVDFTCDGSVVQVFQSLDFMSMQGITAAAHRLRLGNMSNGANLCFTRVAFNAVHGYRDIDHLASGDDYLLMMKLDKRFPGRISYLKSPAAIVKTPPQPDWASFLQQRIRWASKSAKYDDKKLNTILVFAYVFNLSFMLLIIAGIFDAFYYKLALGLFIVKVTADIFFLFPVSRFFNKRRQLIAFLLLQPVHIVYIISAGLLGFIGVYSWKGRQVK